MKPIVANLCAMFVSAGALAGSETSFPTQRAAAVSSSDWYADAEWNMGLWGTFAFTSANAPSDLYLHSDHGWGGGIDAKYFFHRYFGIGVEAYMFDAARAARDSAGFTGTFAPPGSFVSRA